MSHISHIPLTLVTCLKDTYGGYLNYVLLDFYFWLTRLDSCGEDASICVSAIALIWSINHWFCARNSSDILSKYPHNSHVSHLWRCCGCWSWRLSCRWVIPCPLPGCCPPCTRAGDSPCPRGCCCWCRRPAGPCPRPGRWSPGPSAPSRGPPPGPPPSTPLSVGWRPSQIVNDTGAFPGTKKHLIENKTFKMKYTKFISVIWYKKVHFSSQRDQAEALHWRENPVGFHSWIKHVEGKVLLIISKVN